MILIKHIIYIVKKYEIWKDVVNLSELQANIPSSADPQIESSCTSLANTSSHNLLDLDFQEEPFLVNKKDKKKAKSIIREQPDIDIILETLNISDYEEEVAEIKPENNNEETIMDYSASDIKNGDKEVFENIDNLDNSFGWILIWILKYQQRYWLSDTATESLVKFMHYLLTYLDQDQFNNFSESLYLA